MSAAKGCPIEANLLHLQMRGMRPATLLARSKSLRRLARHFELEPGPDLLLIGEADLDAWQRSLLHLAPATRSAEVGHARQFYRFCVRYGFLEQDPTGNLVAPRVPERVPHPIPADDLDTAIAFAPRRIRPMLVLAAYCGLRACEIAWLTREQIRDQMTAPTLVIIGKGDKQRVIPLPARVLEELHDYGLPPAGPVFPRLDCYEQPAEPFRATDPGRISHLCNSYLHSLGIPESLHKLRHFYGTTMYAATKDIVLVQRSMGHASPETTSGYVAHDQQAGHAAAALVAGQAHERQRARLKVVPRAPAPVSWAVARMTGPGGNGDLTGRELQVLHELAQGKSNREIGQALGLTESTVKSHLAGAARKLGTGDRAGIVAAALRAGLVA